MGPLVSSRSLVAGLLEQRKSEHLMPKTKAEIRASRQLLNEFHGYFRASDFEHNKLVVDSIATVNSKKMRNKIAGKITHDLNRLNRGVHIPGIQLKMQIEEAQKAADAIPEVSEYITAPMPKNTAVFCMYNYYNMNKIVSQARKMSAQN